MVSKATNTTNQVSQWIWRMVAIINVFLVNQLGTDLTVILALLGQIIGSLFVEQFGLLRSVKNRIQPIQIVGILVMLAGAVLIRGQLL